MYAYECKLVDRSFINDIANMRRKDVIISSVDYRTIIG